MVFFKKGNDIYLVDYQNLCEIVIQKPLRNKIKIAH